MLFVRAISCLAVLLCFLQRRWGQFSFAQLLLVTITPAAVYQLTSRLLFNNIWSFCLLHIKRHRIELSRNLHTIIWWLKARMKFLQLFPVCFQVRFGVWSYELSFSWLLCHAGCWILCFLMLHHPLLGVPFSHIVQANALCIPPSLTQLMLHKPCLSLALAFRQSVDQSVVTRLCSELSDR